MVTPEQANEWLRIRFADDPDTKISIVATAPAQPDSGMYPRLLDILFAPRRDGADS